MFAGSAFAIPVRCLSDNQVDLATEARFLDMLLPRTSTILDIGCGTGSVVSHLRRAGHVAVGIDPDDSVLDIARNHFDYSWYHKGKASEVTSAWLTARELPTEYDAVTLLGNVLAFLPKASPPNLATQIASLVRPGGFVVVGTTTNAATMKINDFDPAPKDAGLQLTHRYSDWHLNAFDNSPWSVSIYRDLNGVLNFQPPDGAFVLSNSD